jgi:hypothetical protein
VRHGALAGALFLGPSYLSLIVVTERSAELPDKPPYLDPDSASSVLGALGFPTKPSTLKKYRCVGGGPLFVHFGRSVKYREDWLHEWALARLSEPRRSTTELAMNAAKASPVAASPSATRSAERRRAQR